MRLLQPNPCLCQQDKVQAAWVKKLSYTRPKFQNSTATAIHLAGIYEELESSDGFKDFISCITLYQSQLTNDLIYGRFNSDGSNATTRDIQAMLFVIRRILSIPFEAKASYERWRKIEDEVSRSRQKQAPDYEEIDR